MAKNISEEDIYRELSKIKHPEIDRTLVDLGMIRDVSLKENKAIVTLALPFLGIPPIIRDYLVNSLQEKINELGKEFEVKIVEMTEKERQRFFTLGQEGWKGL
ncbi:metal-sulfur cluster biosynthetic enzyme [Candidatus Aerophobetes bacterium]|uniref:Metal-sulfur cluster biosynthetic enzyme n=1 Tax=Aerophobetes bacterium TaxID=2030807 RepID=A0A662DBM2_UNCAE|nr:MAG: metal-sulfur cluster biosynthetic enzyme [Candidatus Aerophobetes bacterium]